MEFIHLLIALSLVLFVTAFFLKEYVLAVIAGALFIILGIYTIQFGIAGINNFVTLGFSIIIICGGIYLMIRSSLELLEV